MLGFGKLAPDLIGIFMVRTTMVPASTVPVSFNLFSNDVPRLLLGILLAMWVNLEHPLTRLSSPAIAQSTPYFPPPPKP
ncbi:MAG: hypothetical protein RLZZ568_2222, partial [Cyanobacteriota bacterium]